jgi:predicted phage terminase large subunit-like protein
LLIDLYRAQETADRWIEALCDMIDKCRPMSFARERGQILSAIGPALNKGMQERRTYTHFRDYPSKTDKAVRCRSLQARISIGSLRVPAAAPWLQGFLAETPQFPNGKWDDTPDALGLVAQMIDVAQQGRRTEMDGAIPPVVPSGHILIANDLFNDPIRSKVVPFRQRRIA